MFNRAVLTSSLIAMLSAAPLWAQDAQGDTTQTAETQADAPAQDATPETDATTADAAQDVRGDADVAGGLNMGTVEGGELQVGQYYIRETYDDWALRCIKTDQEKDPCQLYQLLSDDNGNALAEMNMFPLPAGGEAAAGAEIIVPLYTLLTANLRLSVDGGKARIFPYSFCTEQGCVARIGFSEADVNAFKAGNTATLSMVPVTTPDKPVSLNISLKGFTAGYDRPTE